MRLRRVRLAGGDEAIAVWDDEATRWTAIPSAIAAVGGPAFAGLPANDMIALLAGGEETRETLRALCVAARERDAAAECELVPLLPVAPVLMRAFANSERHWIQGARGLVRLNLPRALPAIRAVETVTRRPFPPFRPGKLFYQKPTFYLGNALTFVPSGAEAPWPAYTKRLDFEIELGAIVVRPLRDATLQQARDAIGGFVVVNDLSARDTQWQELRNGLFGPVVKTKTFASAMSAEIVTADDILPACATYTPRCESTASCGAEPARPTCAGASRRCSLTPPTARTSTPESSYPPGRCRTAAALSSAAGSRPQTSSS